MGKRAAEPASMGIVTSDAVQAGARLRKRLLLGFIVLLVLGGLAFGGWYVYTHTSLLRKPNAKVDYTKLSPTAAIEAAKAQVSSASTPAEKREAYTALGDAYSRNGQSTQSAGAYQQALDSTSGGSNGSGGNGGGTYSPDDIPLLERLSRSYEDAGDTTNAVATLHKLIDAINAQTPEQINPANPNDKDWLLSRYKAELKHESGDY